MAQQTLFFDEEQAIIELQNRGYRVVRVDFGSSESVKNNNDLIKFFYARRRYYNQDRKFPESLDYTNDRKYISQLVKARQEAGLSKTLAVQEAAEMIDALFKYEKLLDLEYPIAGANILGSNYHMNKVCSFMNGEIPETSEVDADQTVRAWNEYYNKHNAEEDRNIAKENLNKILERLNERKNRK